MKLLSLEDEDIKIAPDSFSSDSLSKDSGEAAAFEFLRQKENGNIKKARLLGKIYACELIGCTQPQSGETVEKPHYFHHQRLLYSYAVNRVIAKYSPNSIVAQTSLNIFYNEIESSSPELYAQVSDMAAFTQYILCERSALRTPEEIGRIYAGLCGCKQQQAVVDYGNNLYKKYYAFCKGELEKISYI